MVRLHIFAGGRVQGVGYRYFTKEICEKNNCTGWVKNLSDGRVEAQVQGNEEDISKVLEGLRRGPSMGYVNDFVSYAIPLLNGDERFKIAY